MAVRTTYPVMDDADPIVRGDPLTIPVDITQNGVPVDVTTSAWRAHIRRSADSALVTEFTIESEIPPGGTVESRLLLSLTQDQTRILRSGYTFDLEELTTDATPVTVRTWWIVTSLKVVKDVSRS